jgi:hypothetical protein
MAMIRAVLVSLRPFCRDDDRGCCPAADWVAALSFAVLRALASLPRPVVLLAPEVNLRFDFALNIGISFG